MHDMCALSFDVVLIACGGAGLRALSLRQRPAQSQLYAHALGSIGEDIKRVAFDNDTDTLLLFLLQTSLKYEEWQLVSLLRNGSQWLEVQHLTTHLTYLYMYNQPNIAACGSRVLLGNWDTLYVF